ncbi:hypothetical protein Tco_0005970 [Tanacetum coccineum]
MAASTEALIVVVATTLPLPSPPPSPLTSYSSPLPQIPSSPLQLSPSLPMLPSPLSASPTHSLGYRAAMIHLRADSPSTSHPLPLPPPIILPPDVLGVMLPPRKRLCIALGPRYEIGESSSAPTARSTGGFRADYEDPNEIVEEIPVIDVAELGQRMIDFVTIIRHDTDEIYVRLGDAQDERSVMSSQLNLLRRDRRFHARMARLMEGEAKTAQEA